ncbi:ParB/RepB/Spo0J family partition protein [Cypionkella sp.]|uniref:ParB/RepB/Spo0J family partition protein n=1 Tax=Cypionkella sp. TaxID=2811411 RepID=UPI002ABBAB7F|nr:ParB/RepB/Spo0J family partition protein [Cypionkella sp.]MDZ4393790.1 ParB/RepB/Spo0J family partition protein [Cypionkella sp.]
MSKRIPPNLRMIALKNLTLSDLNSRQMVDDAEIEAMAASIAVAGLLQNLIGYETPDGVEIVGGSKRLRALQKLAAEGWNRYPADLKPIDPVPVLITDDVTQAIAWSGTENAARSQPHPAEEITAYAAMREKGIPVEMIARSFAVTTSHVKRRLALADLPAPVLANLRANKITLDVAAAFTLTNDPKRALAVLGMALNGGWRADQVRNELSKGQISTKDRRVAFVGLEALEAAGATIRRDLFEDQSYIADEGLLNRLFAEKGAEAALELRASGAWLWADFFEGARWEINPKGVTKLWPQRGELPDGDMERYDELAELANGDACDDDGLAELALLQARMDGDYTDEQRATGGVIVYVDHEGKAKFDAFQRINDAPQETPGADGSDGDTVTSKALPAKAPPQNLVDDLTRIKRLALQTALLDHPSLMLDLLAYQLTQPLTPWEPVLSISTTLHSITPEKPEGTTISPRLADPKRDGQAKPSLAGFAAFLEIDQAERLTLLGNALARLFINPACELAAGLASQLRPNTRAIWTPTATAYFKRLGGAALDAIYMHLTPADKADHPAFAKLKNADKAKQLEALFSDLSLREALGLSREENARIDTWLPAELQWPVIEATAEDDEADDTEAAETTEEQAA